MSAASSNSSTTMVDIVCQVHQGLFYISRFLVLIPLSVVVVVLAWRKPTPPSHSDVFTYNLVLVELISSVGVVLVYVGFYLHMLYLERMGGFFAYMAFFCEVSSHVLTCVERHLAVIHPIVYMRLRTERGVRIRSVCVALVWFLCVVGSWVHVTFPPPFLSYTILTLSLFFLALVIVSFCSVSVLCALIGPGPGEGGGDREHVDQSKRRAFYTVMWITGAVWLGLVGVLVPTLSLPYLSKQRFCVVDVFCKWCNFPSTLVLPVLFLHRTGCRKQ